MDFLYSSGRKHFDPRYCRTHAGVARLFAHSVTSEFNADAWIYIADAWSELAWFKERIAQGKRRKALLPPDLYDQDRSVHSPVEPPHQL